MIIGQVEYSCTSLKYSDNTEFDIIHEICIEIMIAKRHLTAEAVCMIFCIIFVPANDSFFSSRQSIVSLGIFGVLYHLKMMASFILLMLLPGK